MDAEKTTKSTSSTRRAIVSNTFWFDIGCVAAIIGTFTVCMVPVAILIAKIKAKRVEKKFMSHLEPWRKDGKR